MNQKLTGLRERLTKEHGIDFVEAAKEVVQGKVTPTRENAGQKGKNVYVASHGTYRAAPEDLITGATIEVGTTEAFGADELRCYRRGGDVCAAVFRNGKTVSRVLRCTSARDRLDEGLLTWFGPVEDICTPWSDNDPSQCQVITLEDLRHFADAG